MNNYITVLLNRKIQRIASTFDCGNEGINNFIVSEEALNEKHGKTFVWLTSDLNEIVGYYNIGTGSINVIDDDNKWYKDGGSIHLNYFALDNKYHGGKYKGEHIQIKLSEILLYDFINRAKNIRKKYVGFKYLTLCSTPSAMHLYSDNGFAELKTNIGFYTDLYEIDCKQMYKAI